MTRLLTCLILAMLAPLALHGQSWDLVLRISEADINPYAPASTGRALVVENCGGRLWCVAGGKIFVLDSNATSLRAISMPMSEGSGINLQLHRVGCAIAASWTSQTGVIRCAIWVEPEQRWLDITPTQSVNALVGSGDSEVLAYYNVSAGELFTRGSADSAWLRLSVDDASELADLTQITKAGRSTIGLKCRDGWALYDAARRIVSSAPGTSRARMLYRTNQGAVLACFEGDPRFGNGQPSVAISQDWGSDSWTALDSITFTNSSVVLRRSSGSRSMSIGAFEQMGDSLLMLFESGLIAATLDGGRSFLLVGSSPCPLGPANTGYSTRDQHGNVVYFSCGQVLQSGPIPEVEPRRVGSRIGAVALVSTGGRLIAASTRSLVEFREGRWRCLVPEDPDEISDPPSKVGFTYVTASEVSAGSGGDLFVGVIGSGSIYSTSTTKQDAVYLEYQSGAIQRRPFGSESMSVLSQSPFVGSTDSAFVVASQASLSLLTIATSRESVIYSSNDRLQFASIVENGTLFVQADSLRMSVDRGVSWSNIGSGLPINIDGVTTSVSSACFDPTHGYVLGMSGYAVEQDTGGTIPHAPGGVLYWDDSASRWEPAPWQFPEDLSIRSIQPIDGGLLVWGSKLVLGVDGATVTQVRAALVRVDYDDDTSMVVYEETRARPALPGTYSVHRLGSLFVSASTEHGVIVSTDGGFTWSELGQLPFESLEVFDVAVDTQGVIYASTRKGIYRWASTVSTQDDDGETVSSHSMEGRAYPNPATNTLRIQLLGLNAPDDLGSACVIDAVGRQHRIAISPVERGNPGLLNGRFDAHFTADVSGLPPGSYVAAVTLTSGRLLHARFVVLR